MLMRYRIRSSAALSLGVLGIFIPPFLLLTKSVSLIRDMCDVWLTFETDHLPVLWPCYCGIFSYRTVSSNFCIHLDARLWSLI